jgi:hypothetical protein
MLAIKEVFFLGSFLSDRRDIEERFQLQNLTLNILSVCNALRIKRVEVCHFLSKESSDRRMNV